MTIKVKWSLTDVWPFDLETTALLAIGASFLYGVLLGWVLRGL
jgi:hypothetical protein